MTSRKLGERSRRHTESKELTWSVPCTGHEPVIIGTNNDESKIFTNYIGQSVIRELWIVLCVSVSLYVYQYLLKTRVNRNLQPFNIVLYT